MVVVISIRVIQKENHAYMDKKPVRRQSFDMCLDYLKYKVGRSTFIS